MKRFNLLSMVVAIVLMVAAVSCTTMGGAQNDRRVLSDRVYVEDPYRGTVVLERDPFTGRYYEVDNYGSSYYGSRYSRNSRVYSNRYDRNYNYRNNSRGSNVRPQPTEEQKKQQQQTRSEARKKILGN